MSAHQIAKGLAGLGRNGDSVLVHMQPQEVAGLQALAQSQGTSLTINPHTGMPEAFSIGRLLGALLPVAVGAILGPEFGMLPALAGSAATGAGVSLAKGDNPFLGALMGGVSGYGGMSIGDSFANFGKGISSAAPEIGSVQSGVNAIAGNVAPSAMLGNGSAALVGANGEIGANLAATNMLPTYSAGVGSTLAGAPMDTTIGSSLLDSGTSTVGNIAAEEAARSPLSQGLSAAIENPSGYLKSINGGMGAAKMYGLPLGGAVLSGLEPSDIYGDPINAPGPKKYDPYGQPLNLYNQPSLELHQSYAKGGAVAFADGGSAALQGAPKLPLTMANGAPSALDSMASAGFNKLGLGSLAGSAQAPQMGLFATQEQIDNARKEFDAQKAAIHPNNPWGIGMFGPPGTAFGSPSSFGNTGPWGSYGGLGGAGNGSFTNPIMQMFNQAGIPNPTADKNAPTLDHLNLNNYADGGQIDVAQSAGNTGGLNALYNTMDGTPAQNTPAGGYGYGGSVGYAKGGYLDGPGDGMSDSIPATIEGKQPARLADGEFVVPADVVSHLGNGSTKAGSQRLYGMLDKVRKARTGSAKQGKQINPNKYMPA